MRLPNAAHTTQSWRIHELTPDFELEDVWELPGRGGPGDFQRLVEMIASTNPSESSSFAVRALFAIRWKLGELFGWDDDDAGIGSRVPTLRGRLPADLRDGPPGPEFDALPFQSLYLTDDEWAAEIANETVHGVMHIGVVRGRDRRVPRPDGRPGEAERPVRGRTSPRSSRSATCSSIRRCCERARRPGAQPAATRRRRRPNRPR